MKILCLTVSLCLLLPACNRKRIPLSSDSEFANPPVYFPGSSPQELRKGGSSTESNTMTNPPAADNARANEGGLEKIRRETALGDGRKQEGGGSDHPTAGGQGKPEDKKRAQR